MAIMPWEISARLSYTTSGHCEKPEGAIGIPKGYLCTGWQCLFYGSDSCQKQKSNSFRR
jgi:hypothetical protein